MSVMRAFTTFLLLLLSGVTLAAPVALECPPTVAVEQGVSAPVGWKAVLGTPVRALERVGFYSGDPKDGASLIPDNTKSIKRESIDKWVFPKSQREQVWFACFYVGVDTFLSKPLDIGVAQCEARYETTVSGSRLRMIALSCQ